MNYIIQGYIPLHHYLATLIKSTKQQLKLCLEQLVHRKWERQRSKNLFPLTELDLSTFYFYSSYPNTYFSDNLYPYPSIIGLSMFAAAGILHRCEGARERASDRWWSSGWKRAKREEGRDRGRHMEGMAWQRERREGRREGERVWRKEGKVAWTAYFTLGNIT